MTDLTRERLAELREIGLRATQNWRVREHPGNPEQFFVQADRLSPDQPYDIEVLGEDRHPDLYPPAQARADAEFMVAARKWWPILIAQCEAGLPASGGVSGEDGELIAKLRERVVTVPVSPLMSKTEADPDCMAAADRIVALLAERDGLKADLTAIREAIAVKGGNEHMPTWDAYEAACRAVNNVHDALSASNAALADALGLLNRAKQFLRERAYHISRGELYAEINTFLAKHGPSP